MAILKYETKHFLKTDTYNIHWVVEKAKDVDKILKDLSTDAVPARVQFISDTFLIDIYAVDFELYKRCSEITNKHSGMLKEPIIKYETGINRYIHSTMCLYQYPSGCCTGVVVMDKSIVSNTTNFYYRTPTFGTLLSQFRYEGYDFNRLEF